MRMKSQTITILGIAAVLLTIGFAAWAQNLNVAGQVTASGAGVHSFMGSFGIGTTTPGTGTKLQTVGRGLFTSGSFDPGDSTPAGVGISFDGTAGHIEAIKTGVVSYPLEINHYGNVGVGKLGPLAKLDVMGTLRVSNPSGTGGDFDNYYVALTSGYNFGTPFTMNTAWGEIFGIRNGASVTSLGLSGNVGIGTTTPAAKLDVSGVIAQQAAGFGQLLVAKAACSAAAERMGYYNHYVIPAGKGEAAGTAPATVCANTLSGSSPLTALYVWPFNSVYAPYDYNSASQPAYAFLNLYAGGGDGGGEVECCYK